MDMGIQPDQCRESVWHAGGVIHRPIINDAELDDLIGEQHLGGNGKILHMCASAGT
jgi:hypothetical protein